MPGDRYDEEALRLVTRTRDADPVAAALRAAEERGRREVLDEVREDMDVTDAAVLEAMRQSNQQFAWYRAGKADGAKACGSAPHSCQVRGAARATSHRARTTRSAPLSASCRSTPEATMASDDDVIVRARAVLAASTPGPWVADEEDAEVSSPKFVVADTYAHHRDATAIALAHNVLPAMLDAIEAAERVRRAPLADGSASVAIERGLALAALATALDAALSRLRDEVGE